MEEKRTLEYVSAVLDDLPSDWLNLTTHRLDIYNEERAKTQFLEEFENLYEDNNSAKSALGELHTAYDYIRLGHPLSCILEWTIAKLNETKAKNVVSFSSRMTPILAVLRKNLLDNKKTQITYSQNLPSFFDIEIIKKVYAYDVVLKKVSHGESIQNFEGSTIHISQHQDFKNIDLNPEIDFYVNLYQASGSIILVNGKENEDYISEIQHVRRRESIAMTPINCFVLLKQLLNEANTESHQKNDLVTNKAKVEDTIKAISGTDTKPQIGSSGLSIQYAIMMGLIHDAQEKHAGKEINIIVPPNCYGGTNDQARRIAACIKGVKIVDLLVDSGNNMVDSVESILEQIAKEDAVPLIIAEIPTNPRVEVPDLVLLEKALSKQRKSANGNIAVDPVFILDQTFCPNVHFLGPNDVLSNVRTIAYISGSKFPSGGKCTAGFCLANVKGAGLMEKIALHLTLCDNQATDLQMEILAEQLPSMTRRIAVAYENTRNFVRFIQENLPGAKINFVSDELAEAGFTPSVFSLDLPTKGNTEEEREAYKRALNLQLINLMISKIPSESKYCVSYGQLKGCYWTIPATSTQGTTKEGDKDYIARVALAPDLNLELHKEVFLEFIAMI